MPIQFRKRLTRPVTAVFGTIVVLVLAGVVVVVDRLREDKPMPISGHASTTISNEDLVSVAHARVFFGHQSVGENILRGVPAIYSAHKIVAPPIEQGGTNPGPAGGFISHDFIGENEKPLLKIEDFDRIIRSGMGDKVDVAMMKFCYIDITNSTDVDELFAQYRATTSALERDYPDVTFVHVTVPLTTDQSLISRLKTRLGGSDRFGQAENMMRERLNALIRNEYSGNHLFDLAALESTSPDGKAVSGSYDGQAYYALYSGYSSDLGHLNDIGSEVVGTGFLQAIARAAQK